MAVKPRVLIISERPTIRESACVLLGTMGCHWVLASQIEEALPILESERASAAVLDLPDAVSDTARMDPNFSELLGRLQGRLVVLAADSTSPGVLGLEKQYSIPFVRRDRLASDLWPCLSALMFSPPAIRRITQDARLILDTFLHPPPLGIRSSLSTNTRQLVYEADHFSVDISLEHPPGSTHATACGQIMRNADPGIPLNGVPVVLKGEKGPLELRLTNQFGEFSFEFENERKLTFEIEVNYGHWIAVNSPALEWDRVTNAAGN